MSKNLRSAQRDANQLNVWFLLSLAGIAFLFVPALVLMALYIIGTSNAVNGWLQQYLHLNSRPDVPWWAALVALLVPLLIILLYFLKLKRRALQVPSTFLWKKSYEDLHVNSLFQWLRRNILLLLQLLVVLFFLFALLGMNLFGRTSEVRYYILMIDSSASMSATDVAPNRLEAAKKAALDEIDAHTDADSGMVIEFNATARILRSYTNDRGVLRLAVNSIEPTACQTSIDNALKLADSWANPVAINTEDTGQGSELAQGVPTKVHVYSDGRFPDVTNFSRGNLTFEYHPIGRYGGRNVNNVGIVTFSASRNESDRTQLEPFVRIANYRAEPADVRLRLDGSIGGKALDPQDREVHLDARTFDTDGTGKEPGSQSITFELTGIKDDDNVVLHVHLMEHTDDFLLDDDAWLTLGVIRKARVLIVDEEHPFGKGTAPADPVLYAFFHQSAVDRVAKVEYLKPAELTDDDKYGSRARKGEFDLVIFDGKGPEKVDDMPAANTWFIDCLPPPWRKADMPRTSYPPIKMNRHPLLRGLSALEEIRVANGFLFDMTQPGVPARSPRLLETENNNALLFILDRQSFSDMVMTFPFNPARDVAQTTWIWQTTFPTFLRNVLLTLGNVDEGTTEEVLRAGQQKVLRPDDAVEQINIVSPVGSQERLSRGKRDDNSFLFTRTDHLGVYDVQWNGKTQRQFTVNLLDPEESNLEVRKSFKIGEDDVEAGALNNQPMHLWPYFVGLALALAMLEWIVYVLRMYV